MAEKKSSNALQKLKTDLAQGHTEPVYILYGEETYLLEYYRDQIVKVASAGGFSDFEIGRAHV